MEMYFHHNSVKKRSIVLIWPLRPVCSSRLALATYSSPEPLAILLLTVRLFVPCVTRRQNHWLQVICKSMLGKAPPYQSTHRRPSPCAAVPSSCSQSRRCPSVNSPPNLPTSSPYCFYLLSALLHTSISTCTSSSAHLSLQCSFAKL